jgi:hypothetical protein
MSKVQGQRRPVGKRCLAGALLVALLFLTGAPVCGSPSDVNPTACCSRHRCRESASGSRSGTDVRSVRGSDPRLGVEHAGAG